MPLEIKGIDYENNQGEQSKESLDDILLEKYDFDGFGAFLVEIENQVKPKVPSVPKKQKYSTPNTPLD